MYQLLVKFLSNLLLYLECPKEVALVHYFSYYIYINDISNICNSNELILFADDTNIFVKAKSKHEVYIEANRILKQFSIYTMLNKLHVNLEKSCF